MCATGCVHVMVARVPAGLRQVIPAIHPEAFHAKRDVSQTVKLASVCRADLSRIIRRLCFGMRHRVTLNDPSPSGSRVYVLQNAKFRFAIRAGSQQLST